MTTIHLNRFTLFIVVTVLIQSFIPTNSFIQSQDDVIEKRSVLSYPPHSVLQITIGISVKEDFEKNHAGVSLGFQYNADLPNDTRSFFLPQLGSTREFSAFNNLKKALERYGYNSLECLKKMICQIAENPLRGGILEEIITFVLTPSRHRNIENKRSSEEIENEDKILLESEFLGKSVGNCNSTYSKCLKTPLDFISYLDHV